MEETFVPNLQGNFQKLLFDPVTSKLIFVFMMLAVIATVVKVLQGLVSNKIQDTENRYRIRKLVGFFGYIVFFIGLTAVFNDTLGNFTVAFGVAGAGVAFALQEVIVSFAGWISITWTRIFKTGDRVLMGGIRGDVIDVGVLKTTLMECGGWIDGDLYNGRIVKVPNSTIFKEAVYNYNTDFPFLWDEIRFPIRYGSDLKFARKIMEKAASRVVDEYSKQAAESWQQVVKQYMIENARVEPLITITADENWITYTLRYVTDYRKRRGTKDALFEDILAQVNGSGDAVKIASAAMDITDFPGVDINIQDLDLITTKR